MASATALDLLLRLGAAVLVGAAIGLNRELKHKPAGLRTHALVSLNAALLTIGGLTLGHGLRDPATVSRIIQGVITGIGFLGAGVIIRRGERAVRGLTTAATIWIATGLGVACGAGFWVAAGLGLGLALVVLMGGGAVERLFHRLTRQEGGPTPGPPA
jgi:putative Mg2+ transporter-C (MgtC) family protein